MVFDRRRRAAPFDDCGLLQRALPQQQPAPPPEHGVAPAPGESDVNVPFAAKSFELCASPTNSARNAPAASGASVGIVRLFTHIIMLAAR